MSDIAIRVEDLGKLYRLGEVGTGTISHDLNRCIARMRGKEDPYAKIGEVNDRTAKGKGDYVWALKNINFEVKKGEVLGIIGRNGAGKSTLLKILSKVTAPSKGSIKVNGRIASLLEVGTGFHPELTGRENIFLNGAILGMTRTEVKAKFDEIVDFAGVERYIDTPVKRYSSGMYVRLAFAVAAYLEPEVLIVDEVLAVGDAEFQKKCLGRMEEVSKSNGRTILFVSHNLGAVQTLCDNVIHMENGCLKANGSTSYIIDNYLAQRNNVSNSKKFDSCLQFAEVFQQGEDLFINVKYDFPEGLDIPNLGFIITNSLGVPVFGSNAVLDKQLVSRKPFYYKGEICLRVKNPRLINGRYLISLWFGNSRKDFFCETDCLSFEITNMLKGAMHEYPAMGNVYPQLDWHFTEAFNV